MAGVIEAFDSWLGSSKASGKRSTPVIAASNASSIGQTLEVGPRGGYNERHKPEYLDKPSQEVMELLLERVRC